jgi:hypothetical protein
MDRNKERINYSYGSSGSSESCGLCFLIDAGLGNGCGRYKAKIKALGMGLAIS